MGAAIASELHLGGVSDALLDLDLDATRLDLRTKIDFESHQAFMDVVRQEITSHFRGGRS